MGLPFLGRVHANVVSRELEPEQLAWIVFQTDHLGVAPQLQHLTYGASVVFSTVSTQSLQLPAGLTGYVTAFRAPQPHRLLPVSAMHAENVLNEPLFFNRQITVPVNASAGSTAQQPLMPQEHTILLTAGITKVAHVMEARLESEPNTGSARRSDIPDSQPAWTWPSKRPGLHWSQLQQQQQEQQQQQQQQHQHLQHAQQLPSDKAAMIDTLDVLEACGSHP